MQDDEARHIAETDQFLAKLRNQMHRMQNPPWWDLPNRMVNRALRMQKVYVDDDPKGRRWMRWSAPLRMLFAMGVVVAMSVHLDGSWEGSLTAPVIGGICSYFAMHQWAVATAYLRGYVRAVGETEKKLHEEGRLRW